MPRLLRLCLLWLGLLLVRFSRELSDISSARKLCGRYLVKEIEKLCGHANWSQFRFEEETPFSRLIAQASEKVEAYSPYQFESPQTAFPARGRGTNPGLLEFAGGPLQMLFAWVSPAEAAEQQRLLPVPSSGSFIPEGHPLDASQSFPV
nr:insulin-like peptide INSL6 isoform X2 [Gorilla gorilla gorilla]XP_055206597.1 insulin-like peptide INSL6 isoform X2 [Gorilla gorilla gorilla]XP_055206598.1 insulin-like peptide INSL6 isoform X2 [Gorilla gorilla gorilla]